jgi:CheY-like chemotaxis protein
MARLLCVGEDTQSLEFRCAVLQRAGYHATPASVPEAETFLQTEHFDLVIVSAWLQEGENEKVVTSAGKTPTLVLTRLTLAQDLLGQVERLLQNQDLMS